VVMCQGIGCIGLFIHINVDLDQLRVPVDA